MIELSHAEVHWHLNSYCRFQCSYCQPKWKSGDLTRSIEDYLSIIKKLQDTRYQHHQVIYWKIGGGEPLHYPQLGLLLKEIKSKPSIVRLDTSGDDDWFSLYGILGYVDRLKLTYHPWQHASVFEFILEKCHEKKVEVRILVPLAPGLIYESRQKVEELKSQGYSVEEQILHDENGAMHHGYSMLDANRIYGRPDDWKPQPVIIDPNVPDKNYVDARIINNRDPVHTGKPCYAGVDWIYISPAGWPSYSQCGGRSESINAFQSDWQPPTEHFPCSMNQCRSYMDKQKIRVIGS